MTILAAPSHEFPAAHLPGPISDIRGQWWLLQSRKHAGTGGEKIAAKLLLDSGCTAYCPCVNEKPLFPSYIFATASPEQIANVREMDFIRHREHRRVLNCHPVAQQEQFKMELSRIQRGIADGLVRGPNRKIVPGLTEVEITRGAFAGQRGLVDQMRPGIVTIVISTLPQGVDVEVPLNHTKNVN